MPGRHFLRKIRPAGRDFRPGRRHSALGRRYGLRRTARGHGSDTQAGGTSRSGLFLPVGRLLERHHRLGRTARRLEAAPRVARLHAGGHIGDRFRAQGIHIGRRRSRNPAAGVSSVRAADPSQRTARSRKSADTSGGRTVRIRTIRPGASSPGKN